MLLLKKIALIFLLLITSEFSKAQTCSTDVCTISSGATVDVIRHSICVQVANSSGSGLFVPTKTEPELNSFRVAAPIAGITKTACSAPTVVTFGSGSITAAAQCSFVKPVALQVGDLIVSLIYESGAFNITPPAGFTTLQARYGPQCGSYYGQQFYKIADAADVARSSFVYTRTNGNFVDCGLMYVLIRGAHQTNPVQINNLNSAATGATVTHLSLTSAVNNSLSLSMAESCSGPPTLPAGYTNINAWGSFYTRFSSKPLAVAGATGDFTSTHTSAAWQASHVIINPF